MNTKYRTTTTKKKKKTATWSPIRWVEREKYAQMCGICVNLVIICQRNKAMMMSKLRGNWVGNSNSGPSQSCGWYGWKDASGATGLGS